MFEIVDNNGTLFSGSENDMRYKFYEIVDDEENMVEHDIEYEGDLRLIQVIDIYR